ncbi:MAG: phytoene/squalene synthase family protein [Verrucomicrobiales bacterium]
MPNRSAAEITKKAKSNLAFALRCVPKERRDDLVTFYAYCRLIDDLADDPSLPHPEKVAGLAAWKELFLSEKPDPALGAALEIQEDLLRVQAQYQIPKEHFIAIIEGCEMDLRPQRFGTWEDLQEYTHRVASSVGLVCLPIFGADPERAHDYALTLGHALQLTNIMRDVGEDLENGLRIYLPLADLHRFQYTERDLIGRVYDGRFLALMDFQAERAHRLFAEAADLLPAADRPALLAPRIMHRVYHDLLCKMQAGRFRVFDTRYRLGKSEKIFLFLQELLKK